MTASLQTTYDDAFYAAQRARSLASAEAALARIAPFLVAPDSIVDIGCGMGGWLRVAAQLFPGAEITGVDHPDVPQETSYIHPRVFRGHDLSRPFDLGKRFSLGLSLEVAEHIPEDRAEAFIDNLVRHSDVFLFSAAAPRQGGVGHVNERWPQYWAEKFASRDYALHDIVRPLIWEDDTIAPWYRQNLVLYAHPRAGFRANELEDWGGRPLIHPSLWIDRTEPLRDRLARIATGRKRRGDWR